MYKVLLCLCVICCHPKIGTKQTCSKQVNLKLRLLCTYNVFCLDKGHPLTFLCFITQWVAMKLPLVNLLFDLQQVFVKD